MKWQDFEVPVLYIETDNLAFARRAFSIVNGKGKKKQTAYQKLRNEVNVVRIDGDTTDEDEVITERKVSIAEKHTVILLKHSSTKTIQVRFLILLHLKHFQMKN